MKSRIFIILYFICAVCYYEQTGIFGPGTGLGAYFLVPLLLVNLFYCIRYLCYDASNPVIKACTAFLILNAGYFIFEYALLDNVPVDVSFGFFKGVLLAMTCIYPVYNWSRKGVDLRYILLGMSLLAFYSIWETRVYNMLFYKNIDFVDNTAYAFVGLLPCVFLIKKHNYIKLVYILLVMVAVISCAKRGAILCGALTCMVIFYYLLIEKENRYQLVKKILVVCAIAVVAYYFIIKFMQNEYVMQRFMIMTEGNTSNRDIIYSNIFNNWASGNIYQIIFGYGYCATPSLSDGIHFAHNDWLELLADTGIVGFVIYVWFLIAILKTAIKSKVQAMKYMLLTVFVIWFTKTLFSMSFMDEHNYILSILIGYALPKTNPKFTEEPIINIYEC